MQLPNELLQAIEKQVEGVSLSRLSDAAHELTERYKTAASSQRYVQGKEAHLAYLLARMPATYAVIHRVFEELSIRSPGFAPKSFLDIGSGPGTGLWAAKETFSSLSLFHAWESDEGFISLSKELLAEGARLCQVEFSQKNVQINQDFPLSDLALISYAIGEIDEKYWSILFHALWQRVKSYLVIIEPGTPAGYNRILKIRDLLLSMQGHLIAPCPHSLSCPLAPPDWCHFYARVERSSLHRVVKGASLGFEDEKFSYLIFSKQNLYSSFDSRILRFPQIHKGHVNISLCTRDSGVVKETITKKDKEKYKLIKKLTWGDSI